MILNVTLHGIYVYKGCFQAKHMFSNNFIVQNQYGKITKVIMPNVDTSFSRKLKRENFGSASNYQVLLPRHSLHHCPQLVLFMFKLGCSK